MQTILVAGGAGFIGSKLCEELLKEENKVICIDNLITGDKKNIEEFLSNPNFQFIQADVTEFSTFKTKISDINYVFHLASPASPNKKSPRSFINLPIETLLANSQGTYNLLELAKENNAKFLFASSSEVYGDPLISPQKEDYLGNVNPNGPRSVYDEGKRFSEAMTMAYLRKFGMDVRAVRIFNTYGPKMQKDDGRVVSNVIMQIINQKPITIYGDGKQTRSFCYVSDMVLGIMKSMFLENTKGEVFNLGNPDERTILDLASLIKKLMESDSEIVFEELPEDDPKSRKPDINKAKERLSFIPVVQLEEGIKETIAYFKNQ